MRMVSEEELRSLTKSSETVVLKSSTGQEVEFKFPPLMYPDMPKFYFVLGKFLSSQKNIDDIDEMSFMKEFDEETTEVMLELCFKSMKSALPHISDETIKELVSQRFLELMPVLFSVNMPSNMSEKELKKKVEEYEKEKTKKS